MKCWTRYVLPLVMALCLFLGSSFFRLDVAAATDIESYDVYDVVSAVAESYPEGLFDYNLVFTRPNGGITLFSSTAPLHVFLGNSTIQCYTHTESFYWYYYGGDGKWVRSGSGLSSTISPLSAFKSLLSSSYDVYDSDGNLFFRGPSPFQRAVQAQDWTAVMMEIVMILPLLIAFLTFLVGLRKGLKFISTLLHQA